MCIRSMAVGVLTLVASVGGLLARSPNDTGNPDVRYFALVVGIADYADTNIQDLNYTDDDANSMEFALWSQFPNWDNYYIDTYIDASATKGAIQSKLFYFASHADTNDVVVFYFSGHGTKDQNHEYIVPWDAVFGTPLTYISDDELQGWLNAINAKKIVILDACFSGGMLLEGESIPKGFSELPRGYIPTSGGFYNTLTYVSNCVGLLAAQEDQYSYEDPSIQHGVFTYFILQGLNEAYTLDSNNDYKLSAEETFTYAAPLTSQYVSNNIGDEQDPVLKDYYNGELPIGYFNWVVINVPDGGEQWVGTTHHDITWSYWGIDVDNVDLFYSINGGASYDTIVTHLPNQGSYSWQVPNVNTDYAKVKIVAYSSENVPLSYDVSDGNFQIISYTPPQITLLWPNGSGLILGKGSKYRIKYHAEGNAGITEVSSYLSTDGGNTFPIQACPPHQYYPPHYPTDTTDFMNWTVEWSIPETQQGRIKVKAQDQMSQIDEDTSHYNFQIIEFPWDRWDQVNTGLQNLYVNDIVIHPTKPWILYAACGMEGVSDGQGIYKSSDWGTTWQKIESFPDFPVFSIAVDPLNPDVIYAGTRRFVYEDHLIYKSTDGGDTWSPSDNGMVDYETSIIYDIVIAPNSEIWAAGSKNIPGDQTYIRIFKSNDGGANWVLKTDGFSGGNIWCKGQAKVLAVDPQNPNILYVGLAYDEDITNSGIWKTTNGGNSWYSLNGSFSGHVLDVLSLAVDQADPQTIYAGIYYDHAPNGGLWGIYRSTDGGTNWIEASQGIEGTIRSLSVLQGSELVAAGGALGPATGYVSLNEGKTWVKQRGTSFGAEVTKIAINDSYTGSEDYLKIYYVATYGSGIWRYNPDVSMPPAPGTPTVTNTTSTTISLSWSAVPGALGYKVYYGTQPGSYPNVVDVPASTSTILTGLTGEAYYIRLKAYNLVGESDPSPEIEVVINLYAPTGLSASSDAPWTSVTLSWQDNSNYETGYEIMRDGEVIDTTPPNATSYSDSGVSPFSQYLYHVRAIAPGVHSAFASSHCYSGPVSGDPLLTAYPCNRKISKSNSKIHIIYKNQGYISYTSRPLSTNNWLEERTLSGTEGWLPLLVTKGNKLVAFWEGVSGNIYISYSTDGGETWGGYEIWSTWPPSGSGFLNSSAAFDGASDTVIYLAAVESIHPSYLDVYCAKVVDIDPENGSWWEIEDTSLIASYSGVMNQEVTGPAISFDGISGSPLIVWSVRDSLYYSGGGPPQGRSNPEFLCEGERPSLAGNFLVYQDGDDIYLRKYNSGGVPAWSDAQYVASGEWPYVTCKESKVYVFYRGDDGLYVSYGTLGEDDWQSVELEQGNGRYISGTVINEINKWAEDTATPDMRGEVSHGDTLLQQVRPTDILAYYLYTRPLAEGNYGVVFGEKDLGPITFSGGPQEAGLKPQGFRFMGVMPNPSSGRVNLAMYLPEKSSIRLKVYDVTGRAVLRKFFKAIGPGEVEIPIRTDRLSSGVYFYQVELNKKKYLGKFSILR